MAAMQHQAASMGDMALQWRLWQLLDSAFPTGGFAHSAGVEASARAGLFSGSGGGEHNSALEGHLLGAATSCASLALPFLTVSHRAVPSSAEGDAEQLAGVLQRTHAALDILLQGSPVSRRASLASGAALVRACSAAFLASDSCVVTALAALRGGCHQAVALGALCSALGVPLPTAQRALLFTQLRDGCASACRLGVLGPMAAAQMQASVAVKLEAVLAEWAADVQLDAHDDASLLATAAGAHPVADALQSGHDALFSRLFQS
jgi:urease accessory protein